MEHDTDSKRLLRNLLQRKGIKGLNEAVGGLGLPSKMPGYAYGLSAVLCITGRKLARVKGTPCEFCYAMRGNYQYPCVIGSHTRRLASMGNLTKWADNMGMLLKQLAPLVPDKERYFRFHDSGDVQSTEHFHAILRVAVRNPEWRFWLPTQERGMLQRVMEQVPIPRNLTIRLSSTRIGKIQRSTITALSSTVGYNEGFQCPASNQKNECGSCRECWNVTTVNVNYKKH